ncbi:DNA-directed RNA polymerase subunit alpha [Bacteroidetes/Chlorobi group bacterium Naka2016]|jgi:DNA-directed RNA polymerase subunit alpha|nr:MAG: DNA-directed RNA polymerase subunit alpha [Bacteroidetes/Chlorobi group bacterium Naka2016]
MSEMDFFTLLQMPDTVSIEETGDPNHLRFIMQPLEKGYGVTIGNSFRRVLISSIPGYAIVGVKFTDVLHEFQSIPGVLEDVTEIILNLKQVRIRSSESKPFKVNLHLKGPYTWTANDIQRSSPLIQVVNPNLHIATLADDAEFDVELRVAYGKGYIPADEQPISEYPIGMLPIDAIYTPIKNVIYTIEPYRVGQKTDYEKLVLDVLTDGTITPIEAVRLAAKILIEHIQFFLTFEIAEKPEVTTVGAISTETPESEHARLKRILSIPVDELEISVRAYNCLKANNIKTLGDIVSYTEQELLKLKNFGKKSLKELEEIVHQYGLEFGLNVERYLKPDKSSSKSNRDYGF